MCRINTPYNLEKMIDSSSFNHSASFHWWAVNVFRLNILNQTQQMIIMIHFWPRCKNLLENGQVSPGDLPPLLQEHMSSCLWVSATHQHLCHDQGDREVHYWQTADTVDTWTHPCQQKNPGGPGHSGTKEEKKAKFIQSIQYKLKTTETTRCFEINLNENIHHWSISEGLIR